MISASDRENAVMLIKEAVSAGASLAKACNELGLDERTYYRWIRLKKETRSYDDLRPNAERKSPANKLTAEERKTVIETVNKPEYASMPPCELVPALADEGIYIGSESTIYRILREEKCRIIEGDLNHQESTTQQPIPLTDQIRSGCGTLLI